MTECKKVGICYKCTPICCPVSTDSHLCCDEPKCPACPVKSGLCNAEACGKCEFEYENRRK